MLVAHTFQVCTKFIFTVRFLFLLLLSKSNNWVLVDEWEIGTGFVDGWKGIAIANVEVKRPVLVEFLKPLNKNLSEETWSVRSRNRRGPCQWGLSQWGPSQWGPSQCGPSRRGPSQRGSGQRSSMTLIDHSSRCKTFLTLFHLLQSSAYLPNIPNGTYQAKTQKFQYIPVFSKWRFIVRWNKIRNCYFENIFVHFSLTENDQIAFCASQPIHGQTKSNKTKQCCFFCRYCFLHPYFMFCMRVLL